MMMIITWRILQLHTTKVKIQTHHLKKKKHIIKIKVINKKMTLDKVINQREAAKDKEMDSIGKKNQRNNIMKIIKIIKIINTLMIKNMEMNFQRKEQSNIKRNMMKRNLEMKKMRIIIRIRIYREIHKMLVEVIEVVVVDEEDQKENTFKNKEVALLMAKVKATDQENITMRVKEVQIETTLEVQEEETIIKEAKEATEEVTEAVTELINTHKKTLTIEKEQLVVSSREQDTRKITNQQLLLKTESLPSIKRIWA